METVSRFIPIAITLPAVVFGLWLLHWVLLGRHKDLASEKKFTRQLIMLGLTIVGVVSIALALPVVESTRNQVIAFIGLVVSGILAFSSTTLFANLMGGLMMRITQPFRAGDFIRVEEYFGRVAERGLMDTEIQTETRELIAIPNTFLISHPVSVIRSSGTIVSATLSLGYDLHHSQIEPLLTEAASSCGLEEPFVHIMKLGDTAVTYKVNGMLKETKSFLTAKSKLYAAVLDRLHRENIEIVSPAFMNQRPLRDGQQFIPQPVYAKSVTAATEAEKIVFDKAEEAEAREFERESLKAEIQKLEEELKLAEGDEKERLRYQLEGSKEALETLGKPADTSTDNP
ncbi:mechanosensitive ion channel family protein [Puniceicoccales bacterium CK1056]|uniref:Mechanosensitive ion channel family protein n=1 Tax=Oceanipulchritudo coccoides TaxID=2706888 RepID=A0A6B2LZL1_9BACT|nr:mechanosensitive ion channel family protein [Oceanipulchritudo coccoides]NDV62161.1 mechanosensitive ion channel family protein [Oceanipulchritudo coccoides]